jgi:hypothetical protein
MSNATSRNDERITGTEEARRPPTTPGDGPAVDPHAEAARMVEAAAASGLSLRVIGGVAVSLRCPSARSVPLARPYRDIDFAALSADGRRLTALFTTAGYEPDVEFNALHGRHSCSSGIPGTVEKPTSSWTDSQCATRWTFVSDYSLQSTRFPYPTSFCSSCK